MLPRNGFLYFCKLEDLCSELLNGICQVPLIGEGEDSCCEYFDYLDGIASNFLLTTDLREYQESWTLGNIDRYSRFAMRVLSLNDLLMALIDRYQCIRNTHAMALTFLRLLYTILSEIVNVIILIDGQ